MRVRNLETVVTYVIVVLNRKMQMFSRDLLLEIKLKELVMLQF